MKAMHHRDFVCLAASAALFLFSFAATASAGFIPGSVKVGFSPPGPPPWAGDHGPPPFVFDIVPDNSALARMHITEDIGGPDPLNLAISGVSSSDPDIEITKTVTNNSGSAWVGYNIGVGPNTTTFVASSSSSDKMTLLSATSNLLTFGLPSPVPNGQTVSFTFKVSIPNSGPFQFDLSQTAISVPEPASVLLLAMGVSLLWVVRRHVVASR
jgi:hypothetical protein